MPKNPKVSDVKKWDKKVESINDVKVQRQNIKNVDKAVKIFAKHNIDGRKLMAMTVESAVKLGIDAETA